MGNTIRVIYQNLHRIISTSDNPHTNILLDNLHKMEADVFMAAETNINLKAVSNRNDFQKKVSRLGPANWVAFSSSDIGLQLDLHELLPWGTCQWLVVKVGEDISGLGRWSFITMEGQGGRRVTFLTAYSIYVKELCVAFLLCAFSNNAF